MSDFKSTKGGFTVQEIEQMAKKYRFEVFYCLAFILAALFSKIFNLMGYSLLLTAIGGIVGLIFPAYIERGMIKILSFTLRQEKMTQIMIGLMIVAIAVILSPLLFLCVGLIAGKALHRDAVIQRGKFSHEEQSDDTYPHS